ncbi:MAG TPA: PAS domain S-box protein, partial [Candidatus Acidoferrales bacterium]|nr:PAS domain S-box protein [Candidatus Acidoferrales bacterium]
MAIGVYTYSEGEADKSEAARAAQTRVVVEWAEDLLSLLKDAESGQRGYLLTGDAGYLEPYTASLPLVAAERAKLKSLAPQNPEAARELDALVGTRLSQLQETLRLRQSGDQSGAIARVYSGRGQRTMDQIRTLTARLVDDENAQLARREAQVERHGYEARIVVIGGAVVLALLLCGTSVRADRLVRSQERLIGDLAAAREQEAHGRAALATTLSSIGDAVITTDTSSRVQFMNPVAEALTGWSNTAAAGRPLSEVFRIVNENTRQPVEDPAMAVLRQGTIVGLANHTILLARDGREVPIDDSGAPIAGETGIAGVVLVFRDVTQRRQARRSLEESERRYRLLFEANPFPMWVFDQVELSFLAVNDAAVRHYGYSREEFLSMTLRDIRPPEDIPALLADTATPATAPHTDGPWRHRKKDGSVIFVEITAHPIKFAGKRACLVLSNDITERRRLEDELRQSQKLEAVGQLAGGIAHDFNNLLTVVEGYAELVHGELPQDDPNRASVEEILVAAQRAASLTRQLLAFSRRQMLQPIRLNLNQNLTSTHRMLSRLLGENIAITTNLAGDLWDVSADPGQIDQIILNLSVNARDAMERGGKLTLATANVDLSESEASAMGAQPGKYARISIGDTGHGMDAETRRHIFEPFFTTKEIGRGTGLGLSTVYGIVKQSGGYIFVDSEPGAGTTFSILLPAVREATRTPEEGSRTGGTAEAAEARVLVVEDDDVVRNLVAAMLRSGGYAVICPATPEKALAICADPQAPIDLLITDMVLPETDGGVIAETAQRLRPGLKVLFMSGYTEHPVL